MPFRSTVLTIILVFLFADTLSGQVSECEATSCNGETFAQVFVDGEGRGIKLTVLMPVYSGPFSGQFIMAGTVGTSLFLGRIDQDGALLWQREIPTSSENTQLFVLNQLYLDREGFLAGVGSLFNGPTNQRAFLFRYNLVTERLQYFRILNTQSELIWVGETDNDGTYLLAGARLNGPAPDFESHLTFRVDVAGGEPLPDQQAKRFELGGQEQLTNLIQYEDRLFATGVQVFQDGGAGGARAALLELNAEGLPLSARSGFHDATHNSRLFGFDAKVVDETLYVLQWGSTDIVAGGVGTRMMISAFSLNGELEWTKVYEFEAFAGEAGIEMRAHRGGLLVFGREIIAEQDLFLLQLETDGSVRWAKGYDVPGNGLLYWRANQQLQVTPEAIYLLSTLRNSPIAGGGDAGILLKLDADGDFDQPCLPTYPLQVSCFAANEPWTEVTYDLRDFSPVWERSDPTVSISQLTPYSSCDRPCCPPCDGPVPGHFSALTTCTNRPVIFGDSIYASSGQFYHDNDCGGRDTLNLTVIPAPAVNRIDTTVCGGTAVLLFGELRSESGVYRHEIPLPTGCDSVTEVHLTVVDVPVHRLEDSAECGDSLVAVNLELPDGFSLEQWADGNRNPERMITPGSKSFTVSGGGCRFSLTTTVPDYRLPEFSIPAALILGAGDSALVTPRLLSASAAVESWAFSPPSHWSGQAARGNYLRGIDDRAVRVAARSAAGCTFTATLQLSVEDRRRIYFPTAFSPNDDGVNDRFFPATGPEVDRVEQLHIMDRWGSVRFAAEDLPPNSPAAGWGGRNADGSRAPSGVYVYVAAFRLGNGEVVLRSGGVTVLP